VAAGQTLTRTPPPKLRSDIGQRRRHLSADAAESLQLTVIGIPQAVLRLFSRLMRTLLGLARTNLGLARTNLSLRRTNLGLARTD
jgi:hypothetical protein